MNAAAVVPHTPLTARQRLLAIGLVLGVTLVAFEVTAIVTAMPTISDELHGDSLFGVASAVYTLANMVALVAAGELADRRGPVMPFVLSIGTFVAGLLLAAWAPTMVWVVIGRTLQGVGTGGLGPIAYILVVRAFPVDRRPMMYATLSAGWVLPSLFAPLISGWIVDTFGWRWVFLAIIPFAIAVGVLAVQPMRAYGAVEGDRAPTRIPYAVAAAAGVGALVTGLQFANIAALMVTVGAGGALGYWALRRLLPTGVLTAAKGLPAILSVRVIATATFLGVDSFVPLAADRIHGVRPLVQGFVIIGAALSWTAGQWYRAKRPGVDPAKAVRTGFVVLALGIALVTPVLWPWWPLWAAFAAWCVGGLGMGLLFNPTTVASTTYAEDGREGELSSQVNLSDALGFSLMGGIGGATVAIAGRTSLTIQGALGINFALAFALAAVGLVAAGRVRVNRDVAHTGVSANTPP
jgi:MFS family permease